MEIFKLFGSVFIDNDKANESLDKTDKKAEKTGKTFGSMAAGAAKVGAAVAAAGVAAVGGMFAIASKTAEAADKIDKMSIRTGISRTRLQELKYAAGQTGVSFESIQSAVTRMTGAMGKADEEGKGMAVAFERLGIATKDANGNLRDSQTVFDEAIRQLASMENATERNVLGQQIFGKGFTEMIPLLAAGSDGIDNLSSRAHELGLVLSDDAIAASVKFGDTLTDVKESFASVGKELGVAFMPLLQKMLDWVMRYMPQIQATIKTVFGAINTAVSYAVEWIEKAIGWFDNMFKSSQLNFNSIKNVITTVMGYIWPLIQETLEQIRTFWEENGETIRQAVENVFNFIKSIVSFVMPFIALNIKSTWEIIKTVFKTAIDIVLGLVKFFAGLLTGDWNKMSEGIQQIWLSLWNGIKSIVGTAWNQLSKSFSMLWGHISGWFESLKNAAFNWGKNMINGFIDGILSMVGAVKNAVSNVMNTVKDFLGFSSPTKAGPGRFIEEWGANMIDGFLDGAKTMKPIVKHEIGDIVGAMKPTTQVGGAVFERGAFEGAVVLDDYGVDQLMDRVVSRLRMKGGLA